MLGKGLRTVLVTAGLLAIPGVAAAASAIVTTDLNIRTGPGPEYQAFDTIPFRSPVEVYGCARGYNWCDIGWAGTRGWVSGDYLAWREGGDYYDEPIGSVGMAIGVPVVSFSVVEYHDRYYRGRPWYRGHSHWRDDRPRWRDDRPRWRDDRPRWRGERYADRDRRYERRWDRRDGW